MYNKFSPRDWVQLTEFLAEMKTARIFDVAVQWLACGT